VPHTQEELDERCAKTRLFLARGLRSITGVSIEAQCGFFENVINFVSGM